MEKDNEIKQKITTTYAEDMAKVLEEDQKGGLIKKIIHGEEEYQREKRNLSPESAQNRFFILIGALFVVISVVTLFFLFFIKVRSVPDVFDSFRLWEKKMFFDLHELFGMSLSSEVEYLLTKDFEDGIVENKNARILYSQDAKIVMAYIFADDNSVIVTNTENAAHEIMLRLASSRVKK